MCVLAGWLSSSRSATAEEILLTIVQRRRPGAPAAREANAGGEMRCQFSPGSAGDKGESYQRGA